MIQTKASTGEVNNVRYINGFVSFSSVKLNVHCFDVDGVLIDTGAPRLLEKFKPFFAESNSDKVVVTHFHEDHVGGAAYLQKEYGLPVFMNQLTLDECTEKADYPFYRKFFWGKRQPFRAEPIGETFESNSATWDVIQTPGHSDDHLSFLNRETGQLFSGDLYVQPQTKVILRDESVPTIIHSIEHVLTYDFDEMFCCHAGYVKNGRQALMKKLSYLKELQDSILNLQKEGYNEKEIQKQLFKKKYPIRYFSFGEWDSIHIIRSIMMNR
ncbi:MBL fold metallo-hydrolase [Ornithinibacillus halophilus]|uniref:Metallo-beta-lactamase superfamily protein n=1 Tax=Ornithinibacillus halophilus TaxID=930117 RepID=A0A1M5MUI6_9BACI|nr:MBL fold metallo-hydrolase [Ornithinibacillus halophilus]SHG80812.1 Metallo-beta-lactamase superfamily protein [Ornithinibacillus halophilus]